MQCPVLCLIPMCIFELVLHIEEPDAQSCSHEGRWHEHQQKWHHTTKVKDTRYHDGNPCVGAQSTDPVCPATVEESNGQAVLQIEHIGRSEHEQHHWIAVGAICSSAYPAKGSVLPNRQGCHITKAAFV